VQAPENGTAEVKLDAEISGFDAVVLVLVAVLF
jgi:hypothetical protein